MGLVTRWTELKKFIQNQDKVNPVRADCLSLFSTLDQGLTAKLKAVDKAAEKTAKREDAASRAEYRAALVNADDVLRQYNQQFDLVDARMRSLSQATWDIVRGQLQAIYLDIQKSMLRLDLVDPPH